eukprot:658300_1
MDLMQYMDSYIIEICKNLMSHITDCYQQESQSQFKCKHIIKLNTPEILLPKIGGNDPEFIDNDVKTKKAMCQRCTYSFVIKYIKQYEKTKFISYILQYLLKYPNMGKFLYRTDWFNHYPSMIHSHCTDMLNHDLSSEELEVALDG